MHYSLTAFIMLGMITLLSQLFHETLELVNIALMHLLPIVVVALRGNYVSTSIIAVIAITVFNVLYIPPVYSFSVHDAIYLWSFAIFLVVGYIITWQAKKIQTNEIRDMILNTLSHDLKTPLSSILASTTLLLEETQASTQTRKSILKEIKHSSDKMHRLINNLLDNARLRDKALKLQNEWCDLEDSLSVALKDFNEEQIQNYLHVKIESGLELYWGDDSLLVRLFSNLLDNAFKYATGSKQVIVTLSQSSKAVKLRFFNESKPLEQSHLRSIFNQFYRLDNVGDISGSGIGLFICERIVTAHGGKIAAFNEDNGVCFEIILPITKRPNALHNED